MIKCSHCGSDFLDCVENSTETSGMDLPQDIDFVELWRCLDCDKYIKIYAKVCKITKLEEE